jgi:hypothetical protein
MDPYLANHLRDYNTRPAHCRYLRLALERDSRGCERQAGQWS